MKTTKQIFRQHNNSILIPEKGSAFEYEKGMMFTDPMDIAFDNPAELSLKTDKTK